MKQRVSRYAGLIFSKRQFLFGEQIVLSAGTFLFTIICAKSMAVVEFGLTSFAHSIILLTVGLQRTLISEPMIILSEKDDAPTGAHHSDTPLFTTSAIFGLVVAVAAIILSFLCTDIRQGNYWLLCIVFAYIRDFARGFYISRGRYISLFLTTVLVVILQCGIALYASRFERLNPVSAITIWGVGAGVGCGIFILQMVLNYRFVRPFIAPVAENFKLGGQFASEYLMGIGTTQLVLFAATMVSGPAAAAALRGADSFIGPIRILMQAMPSVIFSKAADLSKNISRLRSVILVLITTFSLLILLWMALLQIVPPKVGEKVYGQSWYVVAPILPYIVATMVPNTVVNFTAIGLKVLKRGDLLNKSRLILIPFSFLFSVGGALYAGALGGAIGSLTTAVISAVIWSRYFTSASKAAKAMQA